MNKRTHKKAIALVVGYMAFFAWPANAIILEVPIGSTATLDDLPTYIVTMYQFIVTAVAIAAVVVIMFSGLKWASAAGNSAMISDAKERIKSAFMGLAIALASYMILVLINPSLVTFSDISPGTLEFGSIPGQDLDPTKCSQSFFQCLTDEYDYLTSEEGTSDHIVSLTVTDGAANNHTLQVHEDAEASFRAAFDQIATQNHTAYKITSAGTYNWRPNTSDPNCPSNHSFGFAIDLNPSTNPYCKKTDPCYSPNDYTSNICDSFNAEGADKCDLPDFVINAFKSNGFTWGGDWNSIKDYMHFDWMGHGCRY